MNDQPADIELTEGDLRAVVGYAVGCAEPALNLFERERATDQRPRAAIEAAREFAQGGPRTGALRKRAWAANKAAAEPVTETATAAARAASHAAAAAFLHPKAMEHQVKHILGAAAYSARAFELAAADDPRVAAEHLARAREDAPASVVLLLRKYPAAPAGGGRVGELLRELDSALRRPNHP
jgi:hypothetical protein